MLVFKIIEKLKEMFAKKKRINKIMKDCGCVTYCPKCRNPLNDGDGEYESDVEFRYTCSECGFKPLFLFGVAPVPIYMEEATKVVEELSCILPKKV